MESSDFVSLTSGLAEVLLLAFQLLVFGRPTLAVPASIKAFAVLMVVFREEVLIAVVVFLVEALECVSEVGVDA